MSISFGGLGLMSLRKPFVELVGMVLGKGDIRTTFCILVFGVVLLVLAYLTNPSENSFRAYLTEQSFRQHLSRLDDNIDDDNAIQDEHRSHYSPSRRGALAYHTRAFDNSSPFHFANRASVSLRTPKHVFHSFGVFTIAAMVPLAKPDSTHSHRSTNDRDGSMISDSWFIGAFGQWWRGGVIESWYQDVVSRSTDEESWSSGILGVKTLDKLNDSNGLPFSTKGLVPCGRSRGLPPKLRNRERPSQKPTSLPTRSSTPPPLPKSASLPLHTARPLSSTADRGTIHSSQPQSQARSHASELIQLESPVPSRSPSTLFDQSPRIVEVLRQIALSKTSVLDLRTQLTECQSVASQSRAALQSEVDTYRDRKRREDASKLELKSRTKTLEDSKRNVESAKRDSEKRLKSAQNTRDHATQRMKHLDAEIVTLQQCLHDDEASVRRTKDGVSQAEQEIADALVYKRQEIKANEDVIVALNARARELEDKLTSEKEKLRIVKERAEIRKQDRSFYPLHVVNHSDSPGHWSPISYGPSYNSNRSMSSRAMVTTEPTEPEIFPVMEVDYDRGRSNSDSRKLPTSPRPANLALGGSSNFNDSSTTNATSHAHTSLRTGGYSIFEDSLSHLSNHVTSHFSPFGDTDLMPYHASGVLSPPPSSSLIPAGLITSPGPAMSRSDDVFGDGEWRGNLHALHSPGLAMSPISLYGPSADDDDHDPFEVRVLPPPDRLTIENAMDLQQLSLLQRTHSDPNPNAHGNEEPSLPADKIGPRRWFSASAKGKGKKGLNPDAKVFSISRKSPPITVASGTGSGPVGTTPYDALNPNGLGSTVMPSTSSTNNSLLRAFAPSPAEREALQRALGGSTNTSFERLPSLSDVGSLPSSPAHTHAHAAVSHIPHHSSREMGKVLPSWLQSLPLIRKPNFSPWDDEEPTSVAGNGYAGEKDAHIKR